MPLAGQGDGDHRSCPDSTCATYTRRDTRRGRGNVVVVVVAIVVVGVVVVADANLGPVYHRSSSSCVVPVVRRQTFPLSSGFPAPPVGGVLTTACGGAVAFPGTRGGGIGSAPVKRGQRSVCHLQDGGMASSALALTPPAPPTRGGIRGGGRASLSSWLSPSSSSKTNLSLVLRL